VLTFIKLLIGLVILIVGAALATLNKGQVILNYGAGSIETALPLALLGSLGLGLLLGFVAGLTLWLRVRRENARLRRDAQLAREELNNLRALPLKQH